MNRNAPTLEQERVQGAAPRNHHSDEQERFGHRGGAHARPSTRLEQWLLRSVLAACGDPPITVRLWDGVAVSTSPQPSQGTLVIHSRSALRRMALQPIVGFGDGYTDGSIELEGNFLEVLKMMSQAVHDARPNGLVGRLLHRRPVHRRSHTIAASRDNVHHHYDVGNDFYRHWLDERMLYTCAYYADSGATLEQAQLAKMDHVCRKLQLRPGQRVVEAGCGWGALALHMAGKYGVTVKAYNLSHEQIAYARDWAQREGLAQRVEFIEDDYRQATQTCDAFVSVGMLEHVGLENFTELGRVIDRVLTPAGRGLIHSIGRNAPAPLDPWIDKRIFPGAYPPALSEMMRIFEPWRLSVLDVENLRLHYARTLEQWLERYERSAEEITRLFDARFYRTWRLYLAGSIAAFLVGSLQLFQVVFSRESNNELPWTRQHQYPCQSG
ncbi:MAG: class I SAM-dependent methyltransferase [Planctomycetales bacterium]